MEASAKDMFINIFHPSRARNNANSYQGFAVLIPCYYLPPLRGYWNLSPIIRFETTVPKPFVTKQSYGNADSHFRLHPSATPLPQPFGYVTLYLRLSITYRCYCVQVTGSSRLSQGTGKCNNSACGYNAVSGRNFRGGDGDVGIIRSPVRAIALLDTT
jgi:hypothetical protein